MKAWMTWRNLTVVPDTKGRSLVIACDSCGSVGMKEGDAFKLPTRYVAQLATRVALSRVVCSGALPVALVNGVACEMKPTGEESFWGIREELKNAGLADIAVTGSTEENLITSMTALAITVIGIAEEKMLKFGRAEKGDKFVLFGKPYTGIEVDLRSAGFYAEIKQLLSLPEVREIVPAGSKGVAHEAQTLAALNDAVFQPCETDIDCFKSAGPASCFLVLCAESSADRIMGLYPETAIIGELQ